MRTTQEFQERIGRVDGLVQKLESASDPALRRNARELIESLMDIHGAGLERILEIVFSAGDTGAALLQSFASDQLVGSLLVLYGLHPDDFETRVRRGLERARLLLPPQGARLELVAIRDTIVHIKLNGAVSPDVEPAIRAALFEAAPDAADVKIEGGKAVGQIPGFVPLTSLLTPEGSPVIFATPVRS